MISIRRHAEPLTFLKGALFVQNSARGASSSEEDKRNRLLSLRRDSYKTLLCDYRDFSKRFLSKWRMTNGFQRWIETRARKKSSSFAMIRPRSLGCQIGNFSHLVFDLISLPRFLFFSAERGHLHMPPFSLSHHLGPFI